MRQRSALFMAFVVALPGSSLATNRSPAEEFKVGHDDLLTVALLQMDPHGNDQQANLQKADRFCRQAAA